MPVSTIIETNKHAGKCMHNLIVYVFSSWWQIPLHPIHLIILSVSIHWMILCIILYHTGQRVDGPLITFGDIAVSAGFKNADPCTARGCKWERSRDGLVYVPYVISNQYCKWWSLLLILSHQCHMIFLIVYFCHSSKGNTSDWTRHTVLCGCFLHSIHTTWRAEALSQHKVWFWVNLI